jgi:hypothetical protein
MTETQTAAAAQSANGQAPGVPLASDEAATASERVMGLLGIAAAVGLLFIGIDLVSGGALSRALFGKGEDGDGG